MYYTLVVLAESLADVFGESDIVAVRSGDRDNDVDEMHDWFAGRFSRCIIYLCCDILRPQNPQINAFFWAQDSIEVSTGSTVRNGNVKALLRSADAELRRAYFARLGYDKIYDFGEVWLAIRSPELARRRTFPDSTRWPSFARLTPSFEGHTSPLFGRVRQGLAKYGLPYEAAELARWRSMGRAGFEPAKA